MKQLKINVRPKDGGYAYRIGEGINAITGWTRSKDRISQLVEAYERRRAGMGRRWCTRKGR